MEPNDAPPTPAPSSPSGEGRVVTNRRAWIWAGVVVAAAAAIWAYSRLSEPSLIGTWSNRAPQDTIVFEFKEDGSGAMSIGTSQLPYQYRYDGTRDPAWLDLEAKPGGTAGTPVTIRAIAEFAGREKLKIRMPHTRTPGERPTEFIANDLENTILLTRAETGS
jgi:hypothetical protein